MNIKPFNYVCSLCFNEIEEKNVVLFKDCDERTHYICDDCALAIYEQEHSILAQVNDIANREASKFSVADFMKTLKDKKEEN